MTERTVILTPNDSRWSDFIANLGDHLVFEDHPDNDEIEMSKCDGSYTVARNILENAFLDVDIEKTLQYFRDMNWTCDCKIIYGTDMVIAREGKVT